MSHPGLPILEIESRLLAALCEHTRLVLSAPTGSGKSTQIPQLLLRHGFLGDGQVVVLQPRRLAARLLARRVAEEMGTPLGREVGYQVRFERVAGPETRIKFVTEGLLLRQMLDDPDLEGIAAIVFDEFHERHLYGDITLAKALELQTRRRSDLRLLVMSATLDLESLEAYLRPCGVVRAEGRMFPVEIEFSEGPAYLDRRPVWEQAAEAFAAAAGQGETGDVLVFMPGAFEIQRTLEAFRERPEAKGYLLLPLHGELSPRDQDVAVARHDRPKVVVSTNVAETSITIDGVRLVIDSGLARIARHDPWRGINTLLVEKISRASADQRAGRAGRTAPGRCLRLWSREEHQHRAAEELPEVRRLDLAEAVLTLKAAGVEDVRRFRWLDAPDDVSVRHAEGLLLDLGALERVSPQVAPDGDPAVRTSANDAGPRPPPPAPEPGREPGEKDVGTVITDLGRRMLAFPVHPRYSRLLLAADELGCVPHAALIAALTQGRDLLVRKVDPETARLRDDRIGDRATSDFVLLLRAWEYASAQDFRLDACQRVGIHAVTARQVGLLLHSFLRLAEREGLDVSPRSLDETKLRRCILTAFPDHVARRVDAGTLRCDLVHGRRGVLVRESGVQDRPLLVAAAVREVEGAGLEKSTLLSCVTAIEPEWLWELYPDAMERRLRVSYDAGQRRVLAEEETRFRDLAIASRRIEPPPLEAAARLLADEIVAGRLPLAGWDHGVEQWILRLNCLAQWCPEFELPPIADVARRDLVEQICHGAVGYKDVKERPVAATVKAWLNASQQALVEAHAPERLELANGRKPKVTYTVDSGPFIALRIQELYGLTQTPRLALGRVPVTVHILAPSMRPVQITQDLASFWAEHYPRVKSDLQRKYPKHEWR